MPTYNREAREQFRRAPAFIQPPGRRYRRASADSADQLYRGGRPKNTTPSPLCSGRGCSRQRAAGRRATVAASTWLNARTRDMFEKLQDGRTAGPTTNEGIKQDSSGGQGRDANHNNDAFVCPQRPRETPSMPDMGTQENNPANRLDPWAINNSPTSPIPETEQPLGLIAENFADDPLADNPNER